MVRPKQSRSYRTPRTRTRVHPDRRQELLAEAHENEVEREFDAREAQEELEAEMERLEDKIETELDDFLGPHGCHTCND